MTLDGEIQPLTTFLASIAISSQDLPKKNPQEKNQILSQPQPLHLPLPLPLLLPLHLHLHLTLPLLQSLHLHPSQPLSLPPSQFLSLLLHLNQNQLLQNL